jgi:predicted CoA-binding protein
MPTIAIIGASTDRSKFGNKAVRAYFQQGWTVYPVNPGAPIIEGLQAYRSILDVPQPIDRVSLYLPPSIGISTLEDIATVGPAELFLNPGSESDALIERAEQLGLNIVVACSIVDIGISPAQLG